MLPDRTKKVENVKNSNATFWVIFKQCTCFDTVWACRMPRFTRTKEHVNWIFWQCLKIFPIIHLRSITLQNNADGLFGAKAQFLPAFPLKFFISGNDKGLSNGTAGIPDLDRSTTSTGWMEATASYCSWILKKIIKYYLLYTRWRCQKIRFDEN